MYSSTGSSGRIPAKLFYAVNISKSLPKRNGRALQRFSYPQIGSTAMAFQRHHGENEPATGARQ
jgi:hypothetical protein